jgi:hypothetical protein
MPAVTATSGDTSMTMRRLFRVKTKAIAAAATPKTTEDRQRRSAGDVEAEVVEDGGRSGADGRVADRENVVGRHAAPLGSRPGMQQAGRRMADGFA